MWLTCNNEDSKFQILYDDETVGSMPNAQREPDEEKNLFRKMKQRICAHGAKNHFNAQKLLYSDWMRAYSVTGRARRVCKRQFIIRVDR
ncbi:hypothetical protein M514_11367 [Trichuris suis]|uniref:Uncharacterized protein n=1 Tax=Trichuris suis TaxID=68888 RepID=A0A085NDF2_9BILA|nr:hypothetical protein M514_11367 [Trichuris suis]